MFSKAVNHINFTFQLHQTCCKTYVDFLVLQTKINCLNTLKILIQQKLSYTFSRKQSCGCVLNLYKTTWFPYKAQANGGFFKKIWTRGDSFMWLPIFSKQSCD